MPGLHTGNVFIHMSSLPCSRHFDSKTCQDYTLAVYWLTFHFQVTDISIPKPARIIDWLCIYWHVTSKLLILRFQKLLGLHTGNVLIDMSLPSYWRFDSKTARIAHRPLIHWHVISKLLTLPKPARIILWQCISWHGTYWHVTSELLTLRFQNLPRLHTGCYFMHMPRPSDWHFTSKNCQDYTLVVDSCTCHFQAIDASIPKLPGLHTGC